MAAEKRTAELDETVQSTQAKLRAKGEDLLRAENALMALERSTKDESAELRSELEDARDELEATRDELQREMAALARDAKEERAALEAEIERLTQAARRRAEEQEQDDGSREEVDRLLEEAREDVAALREEVQDLEHELAWHEEQLLDFDDVKAENHKLSQQLELLDDEHAECERALEDKDAQLDELDADMGTLSAQIATLQTEKAALEARVAAASEAAPSDNDLPSPVSRKVEERIAAVETECVPLLLLKVALELTTYTHRRDELVAALASASRAHQDAQSRLAEGSSLSEPLALDKAALQQELDAVKQDLDATRSVACSLAALNLR